MLVYSENTSPRLQYILHFLSNYFLHPFELTTDQDFFLAAKEDRINYSTIQFKEEIIWLNPQGLLHQKGICPISVTCTHHKDGYPIFFSGSGDMGFDLFAAIFYLLSRYEEYLPHQKDMYGRYAVENSIAYKNNFLHYPLVNNWLEAFRKKVNLKAKSIIQPTSFSFLPTYDVDMAWAYKHKGFLRNAGGCVQSVLQGNMEGAKERLLVLFGKNDDPFDAFSWMDQLHKMYGLKPIYFFLLGAKTNHFDKNISPDSKAYRQLIIRHAEQYEVNIHPSWQSGDNAAQISKERIKLQNIILKKVLASRQHFIKFTLPQTFRQLIDAGIREDYSMGYGTINGFRASLAAPFFWYDLEREWETNLLLHPFCFMDANSFFEQKYTAVQALDEMLRYYQEVKKVGGKMLTIWHNNFLGSNEKMVAWKEAYHQFIKKISEDITSVS